MSVVLGLEISDFFVRGTLLKTSLRKQEVLQYLEVPVQGSFERRVSEDDFQDGQLSENVTDAKEQDEGPLPDLSDARVAALRVFVQKLVLTPDFAIVGVAGNKTLLHRVAVPKGALKRAGDILPFELETLLPFDLNEVIFDFQPMQEDGAQVHLLTATVLRSFLKDQVEEIDRAGLQIRGLVPETVGLDGVVDFLKSDQKSQLPEEPFFIFDIKETSSILCFCENGKCRFARSIGYGGQSLEKGDQEKIEQEIRRTLMSYRSEGGSELKTGFVSGGAADWPDFIPWIEQIFSVESLSKEILSTEDNPRARVKKIALQDPEVAELGSHRLNFVLSTALAFHGVRKVKHINLLKGDLAPKKNQGLFRKNAGIFSLCASLVLFSFVFSSYAKISTLMDRNASLRERLAKTTKNLFGEEARSVFNAKELMSGVGIQKDPLPKFDAYDVLETVSASISPDIIHDTKRLHIDFEDETGEGRFDLQGTVESIAQRDTIAQILEDHPCFEELKKGRTTPAAGGTKLNYKLEADVRCKTPDGQFQKESELSK